MSKANEYVVAKYLRLSVEDGKTESLSIPNQRMLLDRRIDELEISNATVLEFADNGYTGTNMERPAVQEMLELVRLGRINCIVVKDFSRFSRNAMESGYYIEQLFPLFGVRFISADDNFDTSDYKNNTGGIDVAFKFLMHEYYSKDLSVKVKSALHTKRMNGESVNGTVPYGYSVGENKKLAENPETAKVVRHIFKLALDGCSTSAIRDSLAENAYPTPSEYRKLEQNEAFKPTCRWKTETITRILTNEVYAGTYISGRYERIEVGSKRMVETDRSKWTIIHANHPAIICKEDFERVQDVAMIKGTRAVRERNLDKLAPKRVKKDGSAIGIFPLYGYIFDENHEPQINPKPAEAIRRIFQMTLDGSTVPEICKAITQAGYPTPGEQKAMDRGEKVTTQKSWTRGMVKSIQREIQYTGTAVSGRSLVAAKSLNGEPKPMLARYSQQSEWRFTPNARPAIITEDLFNTVQEYLANKPKEKPSVRNYLLKSLGRCGCCGYSLGYDNGAGYPLYRCTNTICDPTADCHKMKFVASEIEEAVLAIIRKQAQVVLDSFDLTNIPKRKESERRIAECEKQLQHWSERRQQYYEQFVLGEIDSDDFKKLKSECTAQIARLSNQLAIFKQAVQDKSANEKVAAIAKTALSETATPKEIVDALVNKILVFPNNEITIEWKFVNFTV